MRLRISLLFGLSILILTNISAQSYDFDVTKTEELRVRDGMPNFFKKLKAGDPVKVGYLGGSITNGGLWRAKSLEWLQSEYPKANITQINAAIGGKGPDYGTCRIKEHLLVHNPDMIFIEFRVNNGSAFQGRALEGMIPQIWEHNPNIEICMVYTIAHWMKEEIARGDQTSAGVFMEPVANHYGITSIEFGLEVMKLLKEDKLVFKKGDGPSDGKIIFSKDGVHPLEAGHDIYRDVLIRSLKAIENHGTPGPNKIPKPLKKHIFSNASLAPVSKAEFSSNWHKSDLGNEKSINDDLTDRNGGIKSVFGEAMQTSKVGESFTLKWDGFMLGLTSTLAEKGAIQIEVFTDGDPSKIYDLKSRTGKTAVKYMFLDEMESGSHTTRIKLIKLAPGIKLQIGQFLIVDN
ncbi:SGNH/GDSL hydrolase family protein [Seonamhaeicola maritimus]|uniref:SGNH/GDSL hydrolase family protein n=1 Tax=Seonamhaeicola maritimus TaxID=2591822 RepID=A0A5C7GJK8_9FLAO|nr:SGNH/GDSL hydrolase family protein [Seonamhaeicola maritimus]TXG38395.1 SGNH/GDSL hydrolase family protein [Seonamhaeicola maritimus]